MNVTTALDVTNCTSAGNVSIFSIADTTIAAMSLTFVSGSLNIDGETLPNNNLARIQFPVLTHVTGTFYIDNSADGGYNTALTLLDLHGLSHTGILYVYVCSALTVLVLPALTFVSQWVDVQKNAITFFSFPVLTYVGKWFNVASNAALVTLSAPAIIKIAGSCPPSECNPSGWTVYICGNGSGFSYSAAISRAALGQTCHLNNSGCSVAPTTCN